MQIRNISCADMFPANLGFLLVVNVGITGGVVLVGLIGNTLSIVVMKSDQIRKGTTSFLLISLAIGDSVYLIHCFFIHCLANLYRHTVSVHLALRYFLPYVEPFLWPMASAAQTIASWLVVVVTAERYIAICWPLRSKQLCTFSRARLAVVATVVFGIIFNIPKFWELRAVVVYNSCLNTSESTVRLQTAVQTNSLYWLIYSTILHFLIRNLAPFVCLAFLNIRLLVEIIRSKKKFHQMAPGQGNAQQGHMFNVIVTVVVVMFLLCSIPEFIYRIILTVNFYNRKAIVPWSHLLYFGTICNLLLTVNSAINCFIYFAAGKRFRCIAMDLLCNRYKNYKMRKSSSYTQTAVTEIKLEASTPTETQKLPIL